MPTLYVLSSLRDSGILVFPIPVTHVTGYYLSCLRHYLVDRMLDTKKRLSATTRDSERETHHGRCSLQRKCDYLDGEIDRLVYGLYGLTEEEIKIVEGA